MLHSRDRSPGALSLVCLTLASSLLTSGPALAGGGFLSRDPSTPVVDMSRDVEASCSLVSNRTLEDGTLLQVLYPPALAEEAEESLDALEEVHGALLATIGSTEQVGANLYLVLMDSYPRSLRLADTKPGITVWALLVAGDSASDRKKRMGNTVHGTLAHEWAHAIFAKRYGEESRLWRSRWITEGLATYADHLSQETLDPEAFDITRRFFLPFFNLETISIEELLSWKYPRSMPVPMPEEDVARYGAAGGLFLRVRQRGGADSVPTLLRLLEGKKKIREEDLQTALHEVIGHSYEELAKIPSEEKEQFYQEALGALDGPTRARRMYGLAALGRFPNRRDEFRPRVESLIACSETDEAVRAAARDLLDRTSAARGPARQPPKT